MRVCQDYRPSFPILGAILTYSSLVSQSRSMKQSRIHFTLYIYSFLYSPSFVTLAGLGSVTAKDSSLVHFFPYSYTKCLWFCSMTVAGLGVALEILDKIFSQSLVRLFISEQDTTSSILYSYRRFSLVSFAATNLDISHRSWIIRLLDLYTEREFPP